MAAAAPTEIPLSRPVSLTDLRGGVASKHVGNATAEECTALAALLDLPRIARLSWHVESAPWREGVRLSGRIEAELVQTCVVTLDPVPATIDERFQRGFLPLQALYGEDKQGAEHEIVTDTDLGEIPEPLDDPLDIGAVVAEELSIALDPYPRKDGLEDGVTYTAQPAGAEPLTDAIIKPFSGLAELAKKMNPSKNDE